MWRLRSNSGERDSKAQAGSEALEPSAVPRALYVGLAALGLALLLSLVWLFQLQWTQQALLEQGRRWEEGLTVAHVQAMHRGVWLMQQALQHNGPEWDNAAQNVLQTRATQLAARFQDVSAIQANEPLLAKPESALTLTRVQSLLGRVDQWLHDPQHQVQDLRSLSRLTEPLLTDLAALVDQAHLRQKQNLQAHYEQLQSNASQLLVVSALAVVLVLALITTLLMQNRRRAQAQEASRKLTEYFRETQLRAESASRGKSRFLANMSHELRTPFNGIFGMLSLLGTTSLNEVQADYLKTANASANHLLNVLNDILDLSALEEGKISLQIAPLELRHVLREVADVMRPQAEHKKLSFQVEVDASVPAWVHADAKRLKQILFNLANNAVKFTNHGSVHIKVSTRPGPTAAPRKPHLLVFEVEDTGIGIHQEAIENLFQRFNQAHRGINHEYGGTGLGLEISQSLARLMDGQIDVVSTPRVGSCFSLSLRMLPAKAPAPEAERKVVQPDAPPKVERVYRVLVVEDNEVNRKFVDILLKRMGYLTFFAENGAVAIERLKRQSFDLVLMDLHMPVMNGIEATRTIRALQHPAARTPIIALTADVMNDAHEEALDAGVNDFVTKPVHMGRLQDAIRKQLEPQVT